MYSKNDVKEFIEMLEGSSLSVLEIKNGDGSAIRLEKAISAAPAVVMQANAPASVNESAPVAAPAAPAAPSAPYRGGSQRVFGLGMPLRRLLLPRAKQSILLLSAYFMPLRHLTAILMFLWDKKFQRVTQSA